MTTEFNDVLLIHENKGKVEELFCSPQEADRRFKAAAENGTVASIFAFEGVSASSVVRVAPKTVDRVNETKAKLQRQINVRDAMDKHGIPHDKSLRKAIFQVVKDICFAI